MEKRSRFSSAQGLGCDRASHLLTGCQRRSPLATSESDWKRFFRTLTNYKRQYNMESLNSTKYYSSDPKEKTCCFRDTVNTWLALILV
jgi:hypothetical protein